MNLGFLDLDVYSCISTDIATDKVIITNRQLVHIATRHPDACDDIIAHLKTALSDPDYIFDDTSHNHSGLVVKNISTSGGHLLVILRVAVSPTTLSNSVISAWIISQRRLNNYLKNKKTLYKKS